MVVGSVRITLLAVKTTIMLPSAPPPIAIPTATPGLIPSAGGWGGGGGGVGVGDGAAGGGGEAGAGVVSLP